MTGRSQTENNRVEINTRSRPLQVGVPLFGRVGGAGHECQEGVAVPYGPRPRPTSFPEKLRLTPGTQVTEAESLYAKLVRFGQTS